ncbi:MAG: PQQ-binding-like beta-propeller repeat protein [Sulfitobacter sp.]
MTQMLFKTPRGLVVGAIGAAMILGACSKPDPILPGKREDIRSVLQNPGAGLIEAEAPAAGNTARPIALGAAQANSAWTHTTGSPRSRVSHAALSGAPQLAWSADIGQGDSRKHRITADPVVAGGRIYTLDAGSTVVATSAAGETLWRRDIKPARDAAGDATGGGLAVEGNSVYVSLGFGVLAALDVATGTPRWTQQLEASGSGTPTVYGDLVYLTAGDDTGWAVNKADGRVEWQIASTPSMNNILGAPAPALTDDLAIFAFGSGDVQTVFRKGGLGRWSATVRGKRAGRALSNISDVTSPPVVSGDTVYIGNQSGRIAALDLGSGERKWTAREGAIGPVWPAGGSVFALTDLNELVRLDAGNGGRIWSVPLPNFTKSKPKKQSAVVAHYGPIIAGGRVIVASGDGLLRSFDPVSGALVNTAEIPSGATTAPVVVQGTLYVVGKNGQLHAFR